VPVSRDRVGPHHQVRVLQQRHHVACADLLDGGVQARKRTDVNHSGMFNLRVVTGTFDIPASAPLAKFVIHCSTLSHELRKQRGTSKPMILVPLFDLKFLFELVAGGVGTSNRRH
jgi:hypothetical protein